MREVFAEHRPTVVFHAAAYKHVGLMEANPVEAVRNNAIATRVVAHVAGALGTRRFVLVSTDKAVAPATVMGASKALAEFALEAAAARFPDTGYAAVRFGNVLGSSGSVVPIFRRQIERGGPVTVTDERMTRYFMTIPEAVQLIIRSGSLAREGWASPAELPSSGARERIVAGAERAPGAKVFVLDMGEPVRIIELARAMIELSGLDPDHDIDIEIVGRRPGEKLHEDLFNSYEHPRPTAAEKILLAERAPLAVEAVESMFAEIGLLVLEGDAAGLAAKVSELSAARLESRSNGAGQIGPRDDAASVRLRPSYTPGVHDVFAARALAFELVHQDRSPCGVRGPVRDRSAVAAALLPGSRAEAAARVGGPRSGARRRARAACKRRRGRPCSAARPVRTCGPPPRFDDGPCDWGRSPRRPPADPGLDATDPAAGARRDRGARPGRDRRGSHGGLHPGPGAGTACAPGRPRSGRDRRRRGAGRGCGERRECAGRPPDRRLTTRPGGRDDAGVAARHGRHSSPTSRAGGQRGGSGGDGAGRLGGERCRTDECRAPGPAAGPVGRRLGRDARRREPTVRRLRRALSRRAHAGVYVRGRRRVRGPPGRRAAESRPVERSARSAPDHRTPGL